MPFKSFSSPLASSFWKISLCGREKLADLPYLFSSLSFGRSHRTNKKRGLIPFLFLQSWDESRADGQTDAFGGGWQFTRWEVTAKRGVVAVGCGRKRGCHCVVLLSRGDTFVPPNPFSVLTADAEIWLRENEGVATVQTQDSCPWDC